VGFCRPGGGPRAYLRRALSMEDFLSTSLRALAVEAGATMALCLRRVRRGHGKVFPVVRRFHLWWRRACSRARRLERMASNLQRMAVVKPNTPAMAELPAAEQAAIDDLVLLLVPARERGMYLLNRFLSAHATEN